MATQLTFSLGSSQREWLSLRGSGVNPFGATGGPLPQITVPLEARVMERGVDVEILRLAFDLKIGQMLIGQGEIGPCSYLRTTENYLPATATYPQAALPHLINLVPTQGRLNLTLSFRGLLRYRHSYEPGDGHAQGLGEADTWHIESIGNSGMSELDVQIARSDWYEQVIEKLGIGSYLITSLYLPYGVRTWEASLKHMSDALRELVQGNPPGVFGACRAAIDALPGDKNAIFAAMPAGKKRDAIEELTISIGKYIHSGRHVVPNAGSEQAGEFPVSQQDAAFVYNMTKLLLSHIAGLTLS